MNRNRDLPTCSAVPQPAAPPCIPCSLYVPAQNALEMRNWAPRSTGRKSSGSSYMTDKAKVKKHGGNRVRIPKNRFMGIAQTWGLTSSCDIKIRDVPVYAESSNRKDAVLLNWTVILHSPLTSETTLPEKEEKRIDNGTTRMNKKLKIWQNYRRAWSKNKCMKGTLCVWDACLRVYSARTVFNGFATRRKKP